MKNKLAVLKEVKVDIEKWETYYIDQYFGDKWVEEYLHSELHGGGAPLLRLLDKFPWE